MSLRAELIRARPDFPWLDPREPEALRRFLVAHRWLDAGEPIVSCDRAGAGNMNLTLRVATPERSMIVKQARPWVERYDHIAAPAERADVERRFYQRISTIAAVAARMPRLLGWDTAASVLVLEDLGAASDCSNAYAGEPLAAGELDELADYLRALHDETRGVPDPAFANRAMRALNHAHIFEVPLMAENGVDLERYEPGLAAVAAMLRRDDTHAAFVAATGRRYLEDGPCLLHGDYFPGSWLRTVNGLRVIDPEFCFYGDPEVDLGCSVAHLLLASAGADAVTRFIARYRHGAADATGGTHRALIPSLLARYAAVEVLRRIAGVAQLPIPPSTGHRAGLLERARAAMVDGSLQPFLT